jgi:polysaccharide pyruvyl transferase WcaK-like protein
MIKILLYGVMSENNFGGPSLIHGAKEIIKDLYQNYEIVCYQNTKPINTAISDMDFEILQIPYNKTSNLLIDALKLKFGIRPKTEERLKFFNNIKTSDIVANLYGICFCSNFSKDNYSYIGTIKSVIGKFAISFVSKMYRVKTIKCPASYGPMIFKTDIIAARFAANHIFDSIYARENQGKKQMKNKAYIKKDIKVSPDMANLMPYITEEFNKEKKIGISVSHQIIRQWKGKENYIGSLVKLIRHIIEVTGYNIILIPNEFSDSISYNDVDVAEEINNLLGNSEYVKILDINNINSTQIKSIIGSCEVMISSRYHSCVAALSAGVPTLIIGWHYKYHELLNWYGQNNWILSTENCAPEKLIAMFDNFWGIRNKERKVIKERYSFVRKALFEAGKSMFVK